MIQQDNQEFNNSHVVEDHKVINNS